MNSKQIFRKKYLNLRLKLTSRNIEIKSVMASLELLKLKEINFARNVLLYLPINNEVETKYLMSFFSENKKQLILPAFNGKSWCISKYRIDDSVTAGPFSTRQPKKIRLFSVFDLDIAIMPGVAFSKNGFRLGYGKGVYDKLLKNTRCLKIGICFDFQIVNNLNVDSFDVPVDIIVSEKRIIKIT